LPLVAHADKSGQHSLTPSIFTNSPGERINSNEWQFVALAERRAADGYIVKGIAADEGFVLNSKRRWISWLLDEAPMQHCQ
jgi:hypothetical protein